MKSIIQLGDRGQIVADIQRKLNISSDGNFGHETQSYVIAYQKSHFLNTDGAVGPKTLNSLGITIKPGIDVSRYQGDIDWKQVAKAGCKFAYIKAGQGTSKAAEKFKYNWQGAYVNSIQRGAYWFAVPHDHTADAEANACVAVVGRLLPNDLPVALDLEQYADGLSVEALQTWVLRFMQIVDDGTGKKPILYTYMPFLLNQLGGGKLIADGGYELWIARYNGNDAVDPSDSRYNLCAFPRWKIWQYTDAGHKAGITDGHVDFDVMVEV